MVRQVVLVLYACVVLAVLSGPALVFLDCGPQTVAAAGKKKSSKAAKKQFRIAQHLLKSGKIDEGIEAVETLRVKFADDPLVEKTEGLLRAHGVGEEVRITLLEKTFFKKIKMNEKTVLGKAEKAIDQLLPYYADLKPSYETRSVKLFLYESQAHYRKLTKSLTATGHFRRTSSTPKNRLFEGRVDWYYVPGPTRHREREFDRLLLHENAHYLNYAYFCGFLPSVVEEGVATFLETNLCTSKGVANKTLLKERQSLARSSLRLIRDDASFLKFLDSSRGMGSGGASVDQWYALCYAIVDFFAEYEAESDTRSPRALLSFLSRRSTEQFEEAYTKSPKPARRWKGRSLIQEAAKEICNSDLKKFRSGLVDFIIKNYRQ